MNLSKAILLVAATPVGVHATFSILGANRKLRQVGAAGGTCKSVKNEVCDDTNDPVRCVYGSVRGKGAFVVQFCNDDLARMDGSDYVYDGIEDLVDDDKTPNEIIGILSSDDPAMNTIDNGCDWPNEQTGPTPNERQYGVVSARKFFNRQAAVYSGDDIDDEIGERSGGFGLWSYSYSVQGNGLTNGQSLADNLASAFVRRGGGILMRVLSGLGLTSFNQCDLPERLMMALESLEIQDDSVDNADKGDLRCLVGNFPGYGIAASTVFIRVDNEDDTGDPFCLLEAWSSEVTGAVAGEDIYRDPIKRLREKFDDWKIQKC
jgi:hypothetical protein